MSVIQDLTALGTVTEARYHAVEARMAALRQSERALAAQLDALQSAALARFRARDVTDTALRAGVDLRWEQWIAERSQQLNANRALILARIEDERSALARAFGSKTALEELLATEKHAALAAVQRKVQREG